ncbi:MAG: LCP family protein [Anaerolineae bacterium]|nr:LCP family protein [Anaerolineae bacterium]
MSSNLRRGCRSRWRWILFALVMTPVFCCGWSLLIYLIFPPSPTDILILGLDSRAGEGAAARTDSIMLLGINPGRLQVSLLSMPRDLFIDVPGYGSQRINTINLLGEQAAPGSGPALLAASIQATFGVGVDRFVRLDFQGFVRLIDAVGGITIDVERAIVDDAYPTEDGGTISIRFDPGLQHMDGERALIYARTRHTEDDYQRAARQQQVISALAGRLLNPLVWPGVLAAIGSSVETDLTIGDMLSLSVPILANRGRFDQLVIDREWIVGSAQGHAMPNLERLIPWLRPRFN